MGSGLLALALLTPCCLTGSFVNFESGHVRPLALSPSGALLFAVNTPDNRLEIFRPDKGALTRCGEVVVGLEPVAVSARTDNEVYVVNHLSDSVSVVDVANPDLPFVKATLLVGDEPRDVVVAGPQRDRVFITTAHRGQNRTADPQLTTPGIGRGDVWVFDASDLQAAPHVLVLFCDTPRGLAVSPDGSRVYAAAFHSGNRTTALNELAVDPFWSLLIGDGFLAPGPPPPQETDDGVAAPPSGLIVRFIDDQWVDSGGRDWSPRVRFHLPDNDLFVIDAIQDPPQEVGRASGVGTILFNVAVNPVDGRVYLSNLESRNYVRFEPALRGHVVENRVTIVDGDTVKPVHLNPHIDYRQPSGPAEEVRLSLALPTGMQFTADGRRLYVAALGSGTVAVLSSDGEVIERIEVGGGPSGLALHEDANRLYVMQRFDHSIAVVDMAAGRPTDVVPLRYTPEPPAVRQGRRLFYDARASSGHGDAACASCHIYGDCDSLAWDLGDPSGAVTDNPIPPVPVEEERPLRPFHPMKGPMTTQSLRGLQGAGALHWRGDRNGGAVDPFDERTALMAFRPAFESLLGAKNEFSETDMEKLGDFVLSLRYPPNPVASLDGTSTRELAAGAAIFASDGARDGLGGDGNACTDCHALPLGTDGHGVSLSQAFKVPHLRNLYQKVGMFGYAPPGIVRSSPLSLQEVPTPHLGEQVRGFGFQHDGSVPTLFDFLRKPREEFSFKDEPERSGAQKVRELESFLLAFPTGLAAIVGQQVTLAATELEGGLQRHLLFRERAKDGDGDLVLRGIVGGEHRGFLYLAAEERFQSDREGEILTFSELAGAIGSGEAVLTATVVPPGSGRRIALDRDEDDWLDGDELDLGFSPTDPFSRPRRDGQRFLRGDCNGDGAVDLSDPIFGLSFLFLGDTGPTCEVSCDSNNDGALALSDPVHSLSFLFLGTEAPGAYPECEQGTAECESFCQE